MQREGITPMSSAVAQMPSLDVDACDRSKGQAKFRSIKEASITLVPSIFAEEMNLPALQPLLSDTILSLLAVPYLEGLAVVARARRHIGLYGFADVQRNDAFSQESVREITKIYRSFSKHLQEVSETARSSFSFYGTDSKPILALKKRLKLKWQADSEVSCVSFIVRES